MVKVNWDAVVCTKLKKDGNAEALTNAIGNEEECWSWYRSLIESSKQVLKNRTHWSLSFVHKEVSQAAHLLAKNDLLLNIEFIWIEEFLNVILHIVLEEIFNQ